MTATMPNGDIETSLRSTMASVATPVCVVTTVFDDQPYGTTVSAFASLSLRPAMVLVALDISSRLLARLRRGARFGINVLTDQQDELAARFAGDRQSRFNNVPWTLVDGAPALHGPAGWIACDVADLVPGGDHVVVLGSVFAARPLAGPPLIYHLRAFGTHQPLS